MSARMRSIEMAGVSACSAGAPVEHQSRPHGRMSASSRVVAIFISSEPLSRLLGFHRRLMLPAAVQPEILLRMPPHHALQGVGEALSNRLDGVGPARIILGKNHILGQGL